MKKRNKTNIVWHLIIFALSLLGSSVYLWISYTEFKANQAGEISRLARIVRASINPERVATLKGTSEDLTNPDYIRLKEQLTLIANSSHKVRYIYLMTYDPSVSVDKMLFLVDTQPRQIHGQMTEETDLAAPGEIYLETDQKLLSAFNNGKELVITAPETDKWGTFISALEPIFDKNSSKIIALAGVDYEASKTWEELLNFFLPKFLMFSFLIGSIHVFVDWVLHKKEEDFMHSRMVSILKYSNDAIYGCDLEGKITDWNLGAEKLFGYKESEVIGKPISILASEEYLEQQKQNIISVKEGNNVINQITHRLTKNGENLNVSITMSPIYDKHTNVIGFSIIIRNIDKEIKQIQKLSKENDELEELNQLLVGRELKMIELKRRIKELEAKIK